MADLHKKKKLRQIFNRTHAFIVEFDLEAEKGKALPRGIHNNIDTDILLEYVYNARRIFDTSWIIIDAATSSGAVYDKIEAIIKSHLNSGNYYLAVWKLTFVNNTRKLRPLDTRWYKRKFGV